MEQNMGRMEIRDWKRKTQERDESRNTVGEARDHSGLTATKEVEGRRNANN